MSSGYDQVLALSRSDPSLSAEDIAAGLDLSVQSVRVMLGVPGVEDLPAILLEMKHIAFGKENAVKTRMSALTWLVDEVKGRNDARARTREINALASLQLIAALECAQNAVPKIIRHKLALNVTPSTDA